jgi:hypothetical protein
VPNDDARLEFDDVVRGAALGGAHVALPPDTAAVFGTRARFPICATFNGVEYRGSTMPMGDGTFCVGLTRAVREQAGVDIGDAVHVVVVRDRSERTVEMPPDLAEALVRAELTETFDRLAFTHRKEYARWILEAKRPETRLRRIAKALDMIAAGQRLS